MYQKLSATTWDHPGHHRVLDIHYTLNLPRPGGENFSIGMKPMWDSLSAIQYRKQDERIRPPLLRCVLRDVLTALDYVHTECKIIHTDIKGDNILMTILDQTILERFEEDEQADPSPRKFINGMTVYESRHWRRPNRYGVPVLTDFGAAVSGEMMHNHDAQPDAYRAPEVMIKADWSYPIDIWNVGCMAWDFSQGHALFYGDDPKWERYSTRAHLAEVIGLLGPPPEELVKRGKRSPHFFGEDGKWKVKDFKIPKRSLEDEGPFLAFLRKKLQWRPEDRQTAKELLTEHWLKSE